MKLNHNYKNLKDSYLFATIAKKTSAYKSAHPEADIIKLGIGDVTRPLCSAITDAVKNAADDMGSAERFMGYGPYEGYEFITEAVRSYYASYGVKLVEGDVFIGDGAKSDIGNIVDLFDRDNKVLVPDPVYPVYVDTNIMDGRQIFYMEGNAANGFLPMPSDIKGGVMDIIYLCSPNNPTGAVYNHEQLAQWVDYANKNGSLLLFDAAYEAFISDPTLPRSIFEIEGARTCAIEFCSLSKTAGFTGTRCGYTVIPRELERDGVRLNDMWMRRQSTKYNGTSYIIQRAAAAVFTPEGLAGCRAAINYYRANASIITSALDDLDISYTGGKNSPYVWMRTPEGMPSWDFFDLLLERANVVGTPGAGFGKMGEGYFRLTSFGNRERTTEACERIKKLLKK